MPTLTSRSIGVARSDVKEQSGLEVPRSLTWTKWHAGGEFARVVCVKNVSADVLLFTHKLLPPGSAFSVDFPEPRRLSPGMSATIKVLFRPAARQPYAEQLELLCGAARVAVPLAATLPASKLAVPPALDFGCVPVAEPAALSLPVRNVGDAPLRFSWRLEAPFSIAPAAGQLAPGQALACEVRFDPQEAAAFRVAAACSLDNGELLTVQVTGQAKFPFLSLEAPRVDLGSVLVGQTAEAFVRFGNHSPVPARFSLQLAAGCGDGTLSVTPTQGELQANEFSVLRLAFTPRAAGAFSCQAFSLTTRGGNRLGLTAQGTGVGPALRLSARVFGFGAVRAGSSASRTLYLENECDAPLSYQFLGQPCGAFSLSRPAGTIPPRSMTHTVLRLCAGAPGNVWQRLVCLVKDAEPQAVDAFASVFDAAARPPPLCYRHIAAYLDAAAAGRDPLAPLQQQPQHQQQQPEQQQSLAGGNSGGGGSTEPGHDAPAGTAAQLAQPALVGPDAWQLLFSGLAPAAAGLAISDSLLDFGGCSRLAPGEPRSFQVTNNTDVKLLVSVLAPSWQDPLATPTSPATTAAAERAAAGAGAAAKTPQQIFTAFPATLELRPHETATVRLAFRPPRDGHYYSQTLTLLASPKAMRSFRLAQDHQVVPPWSSCILACGHTFAAVNPELAPKVALSTSAIAFPPVRLGEAAHATLALTNHGDTPVHFALAPAPGSRGSSAGAHGAGSGDTGTAAAAAAGQVASAAAWFGPFGAVPARGVLEPKSQQLVALRFQPADLAPAQLALAATFNHTPDSAAQLLLSGAAAEPRLAWDVRGNWLFFRPTCVGAASQRLLELRNPGPVAVGWRWLLSRKLGEAFAVEPQAGVLRGFESTRVAVHFAPLRPQAYNARAAVLLLPPGDAAASTPAAGSGQAWPSCGNGASAGSAQPPGARAALAAACEAAAAAELEAHDEPAAQQGGEAASGTGSGSAAAAPAGSAAAPLHDSGCERLTLTIVGEATQSALHIEPASLAFGPVSVGHPRTASLSLVNQSAGVLRYAVSITDDAPGSVDGADVACEFGSAAQALAAGAGGEGCAAGGGSGGVLADCWVDAPQGVVNARATQTLNLTLLPRRRGEYRLRLNLYASPPARLPHSTASASPAGAAGTHHSPGPQQRSLSAGSASCVPAAGRGAGALAAATAPCSPTPRGPSRQVLRHTQSAGCSGEPALGASRSSSVGPEPPAQEAACAAATAPTPERPPLATAAITACASFPALLVTDAFCEGLPKQVLWQLLGASQLNAELRSPVSAAEVTAQAAAERGVLCNDNAAAMLPPLALDLGAVAAGGEPRRVWLQLTNDGVLPTQWELHSYDAPQVQLESWVEPAKPLSQAERERAFIVERRVFEVAPRHGCLAPGESQQLAVAFNPVAEGRYQLPLFLRVQHGKQLQLELGGTAVPACAQVALAVRGAHSCVLAPAPIGELQPPLQSYTLRNGGPAALQYSLDITPLQQLAAHNFSAEVIKWAGGSPLAGEVAPGEVAVWHWLFQPLEAKTYEAALPLCLGAAPPTPLLLRGRGYHPQQHPEQAAPTEEEAAGHWQSWLGFSPHPPAAELQAAAGPASARCLLASPELLDLGVCLPATTSRQLLTLSNTAATPLQFCWHLGVFEQRRGLISGRLTIQPCTGILQPGEARVCQVSFEGGLQLQLFAGEVCCHALPAASEDAAAQQQADPDTAFDEHGAALACSVGAGLQGLTLQQWRRLCEQQSNEPSGEEEGEEVIAQHPARPRMPERGSKLRQRLPLHLSMTEATCSRFELLKQQFDATLVQRHHQQLGAAAGGGSFAEQQPQQLAPQLLTLTVQGAVLSKAHIGSGSYMQPEELPKARRLLAVAHLLPAVPRPVSLLPPPGSMGVSAAVARAAAASAALSEQAGAGAGGTAPELAVAGAVLQQLLDDAWADEEVAAAFQEQSREQHCEAVAAAEVLQQPGFLECADFVVDSAFLGLLQDGSVAAAAAAD